MNKMNKVLRIVSLPIIFGAMMVLLTACPQHKEPMYKDLGKIPEQYLATVPYQNGDVFRMQHESDRVVIDFTVSRHRQKETGYDYIYLEKYKPAPNFYYDYEADITKCTPHTPRSGRAAPPTICAAPRRRPMRKAHSRTWIGR